MPLDYVFTAGIISLLGSWVSSSFLESVAKQKNKGKEVGDGNYTGSILQEEYSLFIVKCKANQMHCS